MIAKEDEGRSCHRAMGPLRPTWERCRDKPRASPGTARRPEPMGRVHSVILTSLISSEFVE